MGIVYNHLRTPHFGIWQHLEASTTNSLLFLVVADKKLLIRKSHYHEK